MYNYTVFGQAPSLKLDSHATFVPSFNPLVCILTVVANVNKCFIVNI